MFTSLCLSQNSPLSVLWIGILKDGTPSRSKRGWPECYPHVRDQKVHYWLMSYSHGEMTRFTLRRLSPLGVPSVTSDSACSFVLLRIEFSQDGSLPVFLKSKIYYEEYVVTNLLSPPSSQNFGGSTWLHTESKNQL